jgi:hypothetical protein
MYGRRSTQVLNFRLDVYNATGSLERAFIVEMRGASISGQLSNDEEVEVSGKWKDGVLLGKTATNLTHGGTLKGKPMRRYAIVYGVLAVLLVPTPAYLLIHSLLNVVKHHPVVSPLPPNTSLPAFESKVQNDLAYAGPSGDSIGGVTRVICNLAKSWAPGQNFNCFAYDLDGDQIGVDHVVVQSTQPGSKYNYSTTWVPSSPFACNAGTSTPPNEPSGPKAIGVAIGQGTFDGAWELNGELDLCAYLYNEDPGTRYAVSCQITLYDAQNTVAADATFKGIGYEYVPSGTEVPYTLIFAPSQVKNYKADMSSVNAYEHCAWAPPLKSGGS